MLIAGARAIQITGTCWGQNPYFCYSLNPAELLPHADSRLRGLAKLGSSISQGSEINTRGKARCCFEVNSLDTLIFLTLHLEAHPVGVRETLGASISAKSAFVPMRWK